MAISLSPVICRSKLPPSIVKFSAFTVEAPKAVRLIVLPVTPRLSEVRLRLFKLSPVTVAPLELIVFVPLFIVIPTLAVAVT